MTSTPTETAHCEEKDASIEPMDDSEQQLNTPKEVTELELMPPPKSKEKRSSKSSEVADGSNQPADHGPDKVTPSVVRTRQFRHVFPVSSPSDALMSPCTQKLYPSNKGKTAANSSHPAAILREKQKLPNFAARLAEDEQMGNE